MEKVEFTAAVKDVFDACKHLSDISDGARKFTPDGRMVGDIGEVIAKFFFSIELHNVGRYDWDGTYNDRNVQIKTTGGGGTYLKEPPTEGFADGLLMVFFIDRESGEYELVYNGDIQRVWNTLNNVLLDKSGAKIISLNRLRELQTSVSREDIIPGRRNISNEVR
ncbi:hypothetical protein A3H10_00090 [Candidatus Uhrbacteria bacterium RIFCSPLOWO2_12_FULL_46_10]|uniref:DUF6998 domain-containing protein n=1 Tax=Candidatus Uhrbacteria bacterium RIFCSPLOWO2_01_FULL_47_25 TaxID=1802402 RepID=A0A1F7UTD6_9BACT|nr:MAG: hypothetical protein UX68_C0008G0008 [Parcubacteria group bacterium GW2011_GWA2_46_9]OGL60453.1 MAG: hypothetical protein A2752_05135 [Candidatus Uhrbacteria bacterium RIFCSPHIGHO2_01_FULL_46_23]OGL67858.1 MAG: hypothetical protein A3D60_01320 [Candidatus Uhrbacteria bacterium RIFCSPHIGHO2_02_FULL_47_29]OGL76539.1 MAG: hypothetical protein A3E96_00690 [Candidatus Uhrbacteria bacterium RIFCSPHIGHO2_12_FULL_46_13]OGL81525.1 MAG: hypothetical protein A2936_01650 [Candidatus Uhrbacteria bac